MSLWFAVKEMAKDKTIQVKLFTPGVDSNHKPPSITAGYVPLVRCEGDGQG
jgi:hypothetical protein